MRWLQQQMNGKIIKEEALASLEAASYTYVCNASMCVVVRSLLYLSDVWTAKKRDK